MPKSCTKLKRQNWQWAWNDETTHKTEWSEWKSKKGHQTRARRQLLVTPATYIVAAPFLVFFQKQSNQRESKKGSSALRSAIHIAANTSSDSTFFLHNSHTGYCFENIWKWTWILLCTFILLILIFIPWWVILIFTPWWVILIFTPCWVVLIFTPCWVISSSRASRMWSWNLE